MSKLDSMDEEINNYKQSISNQQFQESQLIYQNLPWYYSIPWIIFSFLVSIAAGIFFIIGRYQHQNGNKSPLFIGIAFSLMVLSIIFWLFIITSIFLIMRVS